MNKPSDIDREKAAAAYAAFLERTENGEADDTARPAWWALIDPAAYYYAMLDGDAASDAACKALEDEARAKLRDALRR